MIATEIRTGRQIKVFEDISYHKKPNLIAVKFSENPWVKGGPPGTWYVNKEGYIIAGISPGGYNGRFMIEGFGVAEVK